MTQQNMNLLQIVFDFILNPWFIISLIFWVIVVSIVYLLRNKKESVYLFFPLLVMFKTKKLNNFIRKISQKFPKIWRIFFNIGIFVSFGFMIFGFWFFFNNLISLIFDPKIENAITPLIPGVTIELPLFAYLIIPLLFIMTTHELAHGITAEIDNVDVKSTGIMGAGLFYLIGVGAFVEVDERELGSSKYSRETRLRISTSGTYVNAITTGIAFLLILSFPVMISPFYGPQVSQVNQVFPEKEGGFNYGNVSVNDVIVGIKKSNSTQDFVYLDANAGSSLNEILNNNTEINVSIGDILKLLVYIPSEDAYRNKTIILGPRYNIGIIWEKVSNNEIRITRVYTEEEGGNNYDKGLTQDLIITEINDTKINFKEGYTLEKVLTNFNLKQIKLTTEEGKIYTLDVEVVGVLIGILTNSYWLPRNTVSAFFTGNFPELLFRELIWLFIIGFSITLFNMMPVPIFDGDRTIKELIEWAFGTKFDQIKQGKDKFTYNEDEKIYNLSEYRVKTIESINLISKRGENQEDKIILGEKNYDLIDDIGDGFQDSVKLNFPEKTSLSKNSRIEISYEYEYDSQEKIKKPLLNFIRIFTTGLIVANFILSFLTIGIITFWF
jgi:membrane-associated protease RseP (regulator of RpoE activity)